MLLPSESDRFKDSSPLLLSVPFGMFFLMEKKSVRTIWIYKIRYQLFGFLNADIYIYTVVAKNITFQIVFKLGNKQFFN